MVTSFSKILINFIDIEADELYIFVTMISQEKDNSHIQGTILFFVLFLFFSVSFSGKSQCQGGSSVQLPAQFESLYGSCQCQAIVIPVDLFRLPDLQKSPGYFSHDDNIDLFFKTFLLNGYNRNIAQSFISVHKMQLFIVRAPARKFYFHPASHNADHLPALG